MVFLPLKPKTKTGSIIPAKPYSAQEEDNDAISGYDEIQEMMANRQPITNDEVLSSGNDGSNYRRGPVEDGIERSQQYNPVNQEIYKAQGNPLFGVEGLPRTTSKLDLEGNKTTEFVMPPGGAQEDNTDFTGIDPLDNTLSLGVNTLRGTARTAGYAASNTLKHTLGFGEWLLDTAQGFNAEVGGVSINPVKPLAEFADWLLNTKEFTDVERNYIDQHFPTTPVANESEKFIGDMVGMIVGGQAGKKIGEHVAAGVPGVISHALSRFWSEANKRDPVNAKEKLERFAKAVTVSIPSEAAGASITTPSNMEPITGNTFIDNLAFTYGLSLVGKGVQGAGSWAGDKVLGGFKSKATPENITRSFMQHIDPQLAQTLGKTSDQEIARRAKILGEIANKNATFETGLSRVENPTLQLDTTTAMSMDDAARQYYEGAYQFLKKEMSPEEWSVFLDTNSQQLISNLRGLKRSRIQAGSEQINNKDADIYAQTQSMFKESADNLALEGDVMQGMENSMTPAVLGLQGAKKDLITAKNRQIVAKGTLEQEYNDNALTKALEDFRNSDLLGTNDEGRAKLRDLSMDGLRAAWKADKAEVDAAYRSIPRDTYDYNELADAIIAAGQEDTALAALKVKPGGATVEKIEGVGKNADEIEQSLAEKKAELAEGLRTRFPDINVLWNEGRSVLSRKLNNAYDANAGGATLDVDQMDAVRTAIDNVVGKSTNEQVKAAQKRYRDYANTWLVNKQLRNFDTAMSKASDTPGIEAGIDDSKAAGYDAVQSAITDPTKLQMPRIIAAVKDPNASSTIQSYMLGESLSNLVRNTPAGVPISSTAYIQEIAPLVKYMDDPKSGYLKANFEATLKVLQEAEGNVAMAGQALEKATETATLVKNTASKKAAIEYFVTNLDAANKIEGGVANFTSNPRVAFTELFKSKEAAGEIPRLISEVAAIDPIAAEGIKSQYIRYIKDEYFTSNAVGVDVSAGDPLFARNPAAGKLNTTLNTSRDNVINTINAVFDPADARAITTILDFLDKKVNLDTAKAFTKGSDTVRNASSAQQSTQLLTRLVFGPLSREGSAVNAITGLFTKAWQENDTKIAQDMLDMFIVDPKAMSNIISTVGKNTSSGKIVNMLKGLQAATGPLIYSGVGASKNPIPEVEDEMSDAFNVNPNNTGFDWDQSPIDEFAGTTAKMNWKGRPQSTNIEDRRNEKRVKKTFMEPMPQGNELMSDDEATAFMGTKGPRMKPKGFAGRNAPTPMPRLKGR